ncbi:septum formation inhibitor Maf [Leptobacterium flavescens]|uniref:Septum formation inhibitor Maf n=1 Tax=Leptobacterium flavescens TaxID=472055 RepID=A0A6P0UL95_9FLAO|nr:septum formation inhibitor Maf [Leptobacterium flavescens]NER14035.1 septum formation inhibitor Maf [Leptobacterium flavescens]
MKFAKYILPASVFMAIVILACSNTTKKEVAKNDTKTEDIKVSAENPKKNLSEEFKKYWYAGEAELTSYQIEQARYGELRDGKAVLVFVTEDFLPDVQVKADRRNPDNVPVLKLNSTKNYLTGVYPYSIMTSTFYPVSDNRHAIKVSNSVQEWCGHVYSQLNNRKKFEVSSHSYFEGEADKDFSIEKGILENELWAKIRINPDGLPTGELNIIPSLEYSRLRHKELKAYKAIASIEEKGALKVYRIEYPELGRTLSIEFGAAFPFQIEGWTESFKSGFGPNAKTLTSTAKKIKSIKSPYWRKNSNADLALRDSLGI